MPRDVLKTGLAWLTAQLREHAMQDVVYVRGGDRVALRAHFGEKLLRLDDGFGGVRMEWTDLDLLIPAADLVLGGVAAEPERGDLVRVADEASGGTRIYEVAPIGGEPPWRYADPHRSIVRVHTKFVEVEAPC